jgi:hypothetical protein
MLRGVSELSLRGSATDMSHAFVKHTQVLRISRCRQFRVAELTAAQRCAILSPLFRSGHLVQWENACFTRKKSQVQIL